MTRIREEEEDYRRTREVTLSFIDTLIALAYLNTYSLIFNVYNCIVEAAWCLKVDDEWPANSLTSRRWTPLIIYHICSATIDCWLMKLSHSTRLILLWIFINICANIGSWYILRVTVVVWLVSIVALSVSENVSCALCANGTAAELVLIWILVHVKDDLTCDITKMGLTDCGL